jgi:hypothetical protein
MASARHLAFRKFTEFLTVSMWQILLSYLEFGGWHHSKKLESITRGVSMQRNVRKLHPMIYQKLIRRPNYLFLARVFDVFSAKADAAKLWVVVGGAYNVDIHECIMNASLGHKCSIAEPQFLE